MANKKNLPNIPIYIGDWQKDCASLSMSAQGAWLQIIFKLWTNGKQNAYKTKAKSLQRLWNCNESEMIELLDELKEDNICDISTNKEDLRTYYTFTCRRFVKENALSETRSNAAKSIKKGKQKGSKNEQNTDIDIDYPYYIDIINNNGVSLNSNFDEFWDLYDKKVDRTKCAKKWKALNQKTKDKIINYLHDYIPLTPDKKFRRNPLTFLNNESWENDLPESKVNGREPVTTPEVLTIKEFHNQAIIDHPWLQKIADVHRVKIQVVEQGLKNFCNQLALEGETHKTWKDGKSHFARWFNISKNRKAVATI